MSKRQRFVVSAVLLLVVLYNFCLTLTAFGDWSAWRCYTSSFIWSLAMGLEKYDTLTLIFPVTFTIGVGVFWFLLPTSIYDNSNCDFMELEFIFY